MNSRLDKLRVKFDELGIDGMIVSHNADQRYLTGFSGHADFDSVILISKHDARVVTDFRYWEAAERDAPALKLSKTERGKVELPQAIAEFAQQNDLRMLGFEAQHVTVYRFREWQKALRKAGAKLKPTADVIKLLRASKDQDEIEKIRAAVKLTDDAFSHFLKNVRVGMTEKQAAWIIETYMREHGAERLAFDPIIASGPNAALPHAEPTDRQLQEGEPITIDIGAQVNGYNSDMTRTLTLGHATEKFNEIYRTVLKAQLAVEKKARVGMTGKQVDKLARRIIDKAGYEKEFGHGLGHGVGRVVHEFPRAGKTFKKDTIEPNMVLTVEPGIYLAGWGGVRIEDLVVFRESGIEVLTQSSKEPVVKV
jgi:Xaa-Pro aminopeptidase